ncbi:NAD-dependent epimerase/dehydratase family protein [Cryptosporangium sp. NPDC048952]|uniref:NAD-dependent epimerase/dehydratase family protein n=1 Tax=Cryptosporangium sp. NPDC048952 TaxID=3363961 RepID=UPI003720058C
MTRLMLLGADGFVGEHVRTRLAAEPDVEVTTVTRRGDVAADVRLDLAESAVAVAHALRDTTPDTVVNCAGSTAGDPPSLAANNLVAVSNLVDAMLTAGRPLRLVHIGSVAEYGRIPGGEAAREDSPERPVTPYGLTKLAATHVVRTAAAAGLDAVTLRVTTPIGPGTPSSMLAGRLVGQLRQIEAAGAGGVTTGPLDDVRDYVDIRDVADAIVAAAVRPRGQAALPVVLNVGSGVATPTREMVDALLGLAGFTGGHRTDGGGSTALPYQHADVTAARETLGWSPTRSLDDSLAALWFSSTVLAPC